VQVWYTTDDGFVFTVSMLAFSSRDQLVRVILRPQENVRNETTLGPGFVLRPDENGALQRFVQCEIDGLLSIARKAGATDVDPA
jgi:hypothetical protein